VQLILRMVLNPARVQLLWSASESNAQSTGDHYTCLFIDDILAQVKGYIERLSRMNITVEQLSLTGIGKNVKRVTRWRTQRQNLKGPPEDSASQHAQYVLAHLLHRHIPLTMFLLLYANCSTTSQLAGPLCAKHNLQTASLSMCGTAPYDNPA